MPYPNKYEDPEERFKLWLSLSPKEREIALQILRKQQEQREIDFYSAKERPFPKDSRRPY